MSDSPRCFSVWMISLSSRSARSRLFRALAGFIKPSIAKARATKAFYNTGARSEALPDKLRLKVFNHQNNWTLIQTEDPGRHPTVLISASVRIG
jgi:hypothetical protein